MTILHKALHKHEQKDRRLKGVKPLHIPERVPFNVLDKGQLSALLRQVCVWSSAMVQWTDRVSQAGNPPVSAS